MSKLQKLYVVARSGLSPYQGTSPEALETMAQSCGRDEVAAIHIRLKQFRAELATTPDWNGDEQDAIWFVIEEHRQLLRLILERKST